MSTHADPQPAAKPYAQILHESGDFALEWDRVQEWGKAKYADMGAALLAEFQHRQFQPIHAAPYGRPILVWQENNTLPIIAVRERARPVSEFAPARPDAFLVYDWENFETEMIESPILWCELPTPAPELLKSPRS
jgi:hypothetical protein